MKRGMEVYTSGEVAALRIFIAFVFLSPFVFKHVKRPLFKHWKALFAMGLLGNFIPAFLFTKAETGISSSLAGMLNSLTPLFTLLLGVIIFKTKTTFINTIGILIGFIGAVGLITVGKTEDMNNNLAYGLLVMIATICYALSVNIIKKYLNTVPPITATVGAFLLVGPFAGFYLFGFTDFTQKVVTGSHALQSLGFVCILAIVGTAISVIIFNALIRSTSALFASSVTYLIPIVAMAWGVFDNEAILPLHFAWIGLILLGVYLVNKKQKIANVPVLLKE